MGNHLAPGVGQGSGARSYVPGPGRADVVDMHLGSKFWRRTRWPVDMQWCVAAVQPSSDPESRYIAGVIGVQVADEDLVQSGVVGLETG